MKIYRYTYIKQEIKITEFECDQIYNGNYIIYGNGKLYKKVIEKDTLHKLIDNTNYIMWSLASDHIVHFKILIIERKLEIYGKKDKELMKLEDEILMLERDIRQ